MLALKISSSISASLNWVSQRVSGSSSLVIPSFLPSALLQWSIKSYVNVANAVFPEKQRDGVILAWPFYQGEIGFNCSPSHCSLHFPPIERVMFFWPYKLDILESFPPRLVVGAHILTTFNRNCAI